MPQSEIRFWPGVPDLEALGATSFENLSGEDGELTGMDRGQVVSEEPMRCVLRYPLPGTVTRYEPGAKAQGAGRPKGAGTGHVYLTRWRGGSLFSKLRARFGTPRSSSFATRSWNLICRLREAGVGTAEPLAVGERAGVFFAPTSFLVTRELYGMTPLPAYLDARRGADERRCLATALGLLLERLFEARVRLPRLRPDHIFVSPTPEATSCAAKKIREELGAASPQPSAPLPIRAMPELAISTVCGGDIVSSLSVDDRCEFLLRLHDCLPVPLGIRPREFYRVFHHSLGKHFPRAERRAIWCRLQERAR